MNIRQHSLYEKDFHAWVLDTAEKLRLKEFAAVDIENLIEEIEGMARSDYRELISRLQVLMAHLLKWQYQSNLRCGSWQATIKEQRKRLNILLKSMPSLKNKIPDVINDAYELSVYTAEKETGLSSSIFPKERPYTQDQILNNNFYPDSN